MDAPMLPILDWGSTQLGFGVKENHGPLRWLHHRPSSHCFRHPNFGGV